VSVDCAQQCDCKNLTDAALSAHLSCLKRYWRERLDHDDKLGSELLNSVARHLDMLQAGSPETAMPNLECTACLDLLLQAGIKIPATLERMKPAQDCYDWLQHPLSSAAVAGCVPCLQIILDHIKAVQQVIPSELWQFAVKKAVSALHLDSLKVLLDAVPDESSPKLQQYALVQACRTHTANSISREDMHAVCATTVRSILEHLIEDRAVDIHGAWSYHSYQKQQQQWATALSCMVHHGCIEGVQWLVEVAGVDDHRTWGDYKHSALHATGNRWYSEYNINCQMVKTLTKLGADINMTTSSGATVLHTAALNQNKAVLEQMVTLCNKCNTKTPLIAQQDDQGYTTFHAVILTESRHSFYISRSEIVKLLLSCNDNDLVKALMKADITGRTVLHCAVQLRQLEVLSQLLEYSRLKVLSSLLLPEDSKCHTVITLVRRMGGDSLTSVVLPYCAEVRLMTIRASYAS
jgi:hypothetical protein